MIYLFTGEGGGKTIAALGLALRSVGHRHKVIMVQFMKGKREVGEIKAAKKLAPYLKIYQFGQPGYVNLKEPSARDKELARKGFEFTQQVIKQQRPKLLILDEINLAAAIGLLDLKEVMHWLRGIPKSMDVVLTGRRASNQLYKLADGVSVVKKVKHVFDRGVPARKGIEY